MAEDREILVDPEQVKTLEDVEKADILPKPASEFLNLPMIILDVTFSQTDIGERAEMVVTFDNKRRKTLFTFSKSLITALRRIKEEGFLPLRCVIIRERRMLTLAKA